MVSRLKNIFIYASLTGTLMASGFPPYDLAFLSWMPWIAFAPLCWVLLVKPLPERFLSRVGYAFFLGWVAGSLFFLLTLEWITSVAWEGLVTLPFYLGLYAGVWAVTLVILRVFLGDNFWRSPSKNLGVALFAAASWTALEWARGTLFTGFGWNAFGVAFHRSLSVIQICCLTGVSGLSFLGVMTGCVTALAGKRLIAGLQQHREGLKPLHGWRLPAVDLFFTFLLIVAVVSYGLREILAPAPVVEHLYVAAVQGNIPQNQKWDRAFEEEIMNIYASHSRRALTLHPDLIVWPESAVPRPLLQDQATFDRVQQLAQQGETDFLIGSLDYEENPRRDYNAAILLTEHATKSQVYAKVHLLPFGEYIPCRKSFPLFAWVTGDRILGDFDAGPGPRLLELSIKPVKVAPLLCFEDTLGNLVRGFADLGAQVMINLTNDGWFGYTAASRQHLVNALFRCVETKLPMLRVANTGVTCVIDRYGRVLQTLQEPDGNTFFEGVLFTQLAVPQEPKKTFYTRHGDWFSFLCLGVTVVALGGALACRRKKSG